MSFYPPKRTLMGPGPSDVNPRISLALARPTIGHLDPEFIRLMDEIKALLQYAFKTKNLLTLPISAPGSAGMEACFVNLIEAGDTVIVCQNGVFGGRMKENVERAGGTAVMVNDAWGQAIDLDKLDAAIKANPDAKAIAFVHAETSTGVRSDAQAICKLAQDNDMLSIMDTVTGLAGIEVDVDGWGADAVYSGTQKCLSCVPGISPVTFSERAQSVITNRQLPVQSWFLDMNLIMGYWGEGRQRAYHHTAPVNALYALHEALTILREEGLEQSWARHLRNHEALKAGLTGLGLSLLVDEACRLPQLNAVGVPKGVDEAAVRQRLLQQSNLEIGAGLGELAGKVWRIGLMGYASNETNVRLCIHALESALLAQNVPLNPGEGIARVDAAYASSDGA
ncbi:serine--pyruvate aminotransferase [Arenicella chitinivorans]|uniref:Serine--pyruvate aminotransferase n=1 Tax=Arenicella chitinivorans TaxID=1329800 RepID=A0A918RY25_9GAMM|nr:alanine--glyoxylate aminotransferase family protein [Arenicella chitinivorans]GHA15931.1 serine--pyruvate aminotransferase [Arenicella chitinivorans]